MPEKQYEPIEMIYLGRRIDHKGKLCYAYALPQSIENYKLWNKPLVAGAKPGALFKFHRMIKVDSPNSFYIYTAKMGEYSPEFLRVFDEPTLVKEWAFEDSKAAQKKESEKLARKTMAESVDPTKDLEFWSDQYHKAYSGAARAAVLATVIEMITKPKSRFK